MTGLRVLEAVVRTGSLSAAARELCVTPPAISHRLRDLEAQSGAVLVQRLGGRFVATELGKQVLDALGDAFARILAADALLSAQKPETLRVVSSYSFAVLWLTPRLARFQARHPEVALFLEPSHSPLDHGAGDITILHAAEAPEKDGWTRLFADKCAAIGRADHPIIAQGRAAPTSVFKSKLVHISHGKGPAGGEFSWQAWAMALRLAGQVPAVGPTVTAEHLAVDLVLAEDLLALVSLVNASLLLADGRLRAIPGSEAATGCSYWIKVTNRQSRGVGTAQDFLAWVQGELAE
jgi:LysR family transcriptional regulator, glycine cleavage system transcriptional activator